MSLLRSFDNLENVIVRHRITGEEIPARVTETGVIREQDGPAAFSKGLYEVLGEAADE